jgi:4-amino-4-deoxy-L-arabinose transferase-like glycosyltransferase
MLSVLFLATRLIHLSADPPNNISIDSCSEYGDPGNYAFNARSKVVLGQWNIDELGAAPFSPIPHFLTYLSFLIFGTGTWQMNLVPWLFGGLLLLALFILASRYFPEARLLFFGLLVVNFPFGIFGRINDQVMPMTFFVIPAIYFFLKAWDNPRFFILTSLFLSLSFISKSKMIYFHLGVIPLAFLLITLQRGEGRNVKLLFLRIVYLAAGLLLVAVPWYFLIYSRYPEVFHNIVALNSAAAIPKSIPHALSNWVQKPPFSFHPANRILTIVLFAYLLILLLKLFDRKVKSRLSALEIICVLWLVVGLGTQAFLGYRPIRHYIEYTIPMLILVSLFLVRLSAGWRIDHALKKRGLFLGALFVLVWAGLSSYSRRFVTTEIWFSHRERVLLIALLISIGATILLYVLLDKGFPRWKIVLPKNAARLALAVVVAIYAYQNLAEHARWLRDPTYDLKTIGRDLGKAFPQGIFSGLLMPSLSLENRNTVHTSFPGYANDDPGFLERAGVTHLFVATYNNEPDYYQKVFPDAFGRAKLLARYRMWRSWFLLYELRKAEPIADDPTRHEAEIMEREAGIPLFDSRASGAFSVRVAVTKPVIIGREKIGLPGHAEFQGRLFIKTDDGASEGLVVRVRLSRKGIVHYEKKFGLDPASDSSDYLALPFKCYLEEPGSYLLEVRASGRGVLRFDKVELAP